MTNVTEGLPLVIVVIPQSEFELNPLSESVSVFMNFLHDGPRLRILSKLLEVIILQQLHNYLQQVGYMANK